MSIRQKLARLNHPLARLTNTLNPGVRVLMYHRVDDLNAYDQLTVRPAVFEEQMHWLSHNRNVQPTSELFSSMTSGADKKGLVAITFDDGYLDNLEKALPILEKYQLPATIYITTDFAEQTVSHYRYGAATERLHLNWDEIRMLSEHPLITIGSHTVSHPMLSNLDAAKARDEIARSKQEIESRIKQPVEEFCYPSGNFTTREKRLVEEAGYRYAVSVKPGVNHQRHDPFAFNRTEVNDKDGTEDFIMKMDGALDIFHRLLHLRREAMFSRDRRNTKQS